MLDSSYPNSAFDPVYSDDEFVADPTVQWVRAWNKVKRAKSQQAGRGVKLRSASRGKQFTVRFPASRGVLKPFAFAGVTASYRLRREILPRQATAAVVERRPGDTKAEKFKPS